MTNSVQSKKHDLFVCLLVCSFIEKNLQEAIPFVNILTVSLVFNKNLIVDVDQHSMSFTQQIPEFRPSRNWYSEKRLPLQF